VTTFTNKEIVEGRKILVKNTVARRMTVVTRSKRCLMLDLDLTLVSTQKLKDLQFLSELLSDARTLPLRERLYHFNIENYEGPGIGSSMPIWGIARPHYKEFLKFAYQEFDEVIVWSAGQRLYVEPLVDFLFRDLQRPRVVYNAEMLDRSKGNGMVKTINTILQEPSLSGITLAGTLALDDNSGTFADNVHNGVHIPEYNPHMSLEGFMADDRCLLDFQRWLQTPEVANSADVRMLAKHMIFTSRDN